MQIIEREMTPAELAQMNAGFDQHSLEHGSEVQHSERMGYVAQNGDAFIGCVSGLAYKNESQYSGWFFLTDLYVEKAFRAQGIGAALLVALEEKLCRLGIRRIWTWTAGFEGPGFYQKQGYAVFAELEGWYSNGASRVAVRKDLEVCGSRISKKRDKN